MTNFDEGIITPEVQAEFLKKYAHLIGIIGEDKYYVYDHKPVSHELSDKAFRVIHVNGKPVQIIKMSKEEAETLVKCSNLKLGDF